MAGTVSSKFRRLYLRCLWDTARKGGVPLNEALMQSAQTSFDQIKQGRVLLSTSANGHSVEFSAPSTDGLTPESLVDMHEDFFALYASAVEDGNTSDDTIYAAMLAEMETGTMAGVKVYRNDFSLYGRFTV